MANAIKTVMTYDLNSSKVDFNIPFEYLARKFVTVTLIGTNRKVLVLNQDYRFTTKNQVTTTKAWGPADGYQSIEIRRFTSATDRLVDFADGSILRAYDLNIAQVQTLHVAEEARDLTADTIGVNNEGNLDARGRRIVNVATAVAAGDAVNLLQVQQMSNGAYQSALNSAASAAEATRQQQEATRQAGISGGWAGNSQNAAIASENSRAASRASEVNAKTSETNSKSSENMARLWATQDKGVPVVAGFYSSMSWALTSADRATDSANSAAASANSAASSKTQADRAKAEADKLANNNALVSTIDSVNTTDYTVSWKGIHYFRAIEVTAPTPFIDFHFNNATADYTHRIIADTATRLFITSGLRVDGGLATNNDFSAVRGTFSGDLTTQTTISSNGTGRNYIRGSAHIVGMQTGVNGNNGLHIGWNESNGTGEGSFVNNRGGGVGGYVFRTVNYENTVETGRVTFSGAGDIAATGGIRVTGNITAGASVFAGGGTSVMAGDGNVSGSIWGGWLFNWLTANVMSDFGRGAQQYRGSSRTSWEAPAGCVMTGLNMNVGDGRDTGIYFRQLVGRKVGGGTFGIGDFA